jgi:hypothetical protein
LTPYAFDATVDIAVDGVTVTVATVWAEADMVATAQGATTRAAPTATAPSLVRRRPNSTRTLDE